MFPNASVHWIAAPWDFTARLRGAAGRGVVNRIEPEPETARFLDDLVQLAEEIARRVPDRLQFARTFTERLMSDFAGRVADDVSVYHFEIESAAGPVPLRLYRPSLPRGAHARLPLILFFHGGGWMVGGAASYEPFVKSLCAGAGVLFLSVDFRLAPEHKFPAALDDCCAAAHWACAEAKELGADPDRVAVMGDSAGGNLAVATAYHIRKRTEYRLSAQYLLYPFLDLRGRHVPYKSRRRFGDGRYLISLDDLEWSAQWYVNDAASREDPRVSPILLPDLSSLPPTVLLTAGFDPLADEGLLFGRMLLDAGVPVLARHFAQTIHGFLPFGVLRVARQGQKWLASEIRQRLFFSDSGSAARKG